MLVLLCWIAFRLINMLLSWELAFNACIHFCCFNMKLMLFRSAEVKCSLNMYEQYVFKVSEIKKIWWSDESFSFYYPIVKSDFFPILLFIISDYFAHTGSHSLTMMFQPWPYPCILPWKSILLLKILKSFCPVIDGWFLHFKSKVKITVRQMNACQEAFLAI